jgi:hypothetical protein
MNSQITIGNYLNTGYSFVNGTRIVTITGLQQPLDISKIKLFANQTQNKLYGAKTFWSGNVTQQNVVAAALTVGTATSGGGVTAGTHQYKYTFVYATGEESLASPASSVITVVGGTQTVPLTAIAVGNSNVVARNIYRTIAGGTIYLYLAQISDNTTTTYSDIISDATITTANTPEPVTSGAYDIVLANSFNVLATGDILDIEVEVSNANEDDDLGVTKNVNIDSSELPPADSEVAVITYTNNAAGTVFDEIPVGNWRNTCFQIKATCSTAPSIIKVYATLDDTIAVTATNAAPTVDWVDKTEEIFGLPQVLVPITGTFISPILNWAVDGFGRMVMNQRFMVMYSTLGTTNFIQITKKSF